MSAREVCEAVKRGDLEAVRQMVERNPSLKDEPYRRGMTPLHWAAYYGQVHIARYLIDHEGVDKDNTDHLGRTPTYFAVIKGHLDVVRYLIEEGADDTLKNEYGRTALTFAEQEYHAEVADALREYMPGGIMFQRRDAVVDAVLNQKDLGPDVARFCGDFVLYRKNRNRPRQG